MTRTHAVALAAAVVVLVGPERATAECCFDCDADGRVSIGELVAAVQNASAGCSEAPTPCCGDCDGSGDVHVFELLRAVSTALFGCSTAGRFVDNGDGTISDLKTGLMWEKKVARDGRFDFANPHDSDNNYALSGSCRNGSSFRCQPTRAAARACRAGAIGMVHDLYSDCRECEGANGPCSHEETIWTWVLGLNASRFAGYTDWRLPTINELAMTLDYGASQPPRVDAAFHRPACDQGCRDLESPECSCTESASGRYYWSRSFYTSGDFRRSAAVIRYDFADEVACPPFHIHRLRAVRGGA